MATITPTLPVESPAEPPVLPVIHPDTLGYKTVEFDTALAQQRIEEGANPSRRHGIANRALQSLGLAAPEPPEQVIESIAYKEIVQQEQIDSVRNRLTSITPSKKPALTEAVIATMPPFLYDQFEIEHPESVEEEFPHSLVDWLTESSYKDMPDTTPQEKQAREEKHKAENARLLNFLQAHNHYVENFQQDDKFLEKVEVQKQRWAQGVARGLNSGYYDESARERAQNVDALRVYEGDDFSTLLADMAGFHNRGTSTVVVSRKHIGRSTVHELNHALLWGGDVEKLADDPLNTRWADEALTEHAAQLNKAAGAQDPEVMHLEWGSYRGFRGLLGAAVEVAREKGMQVSMKRMLLAYSSAGEDRTRRTAWLDREFDKVFGTEEFFVTVQARLNEHVELSQNEFKRQGKELPARHVLYNEAAVVLAARLRKNGRVPINWN